MPFDVGKTPDSYKANSAMRGNASTGIYIGIVKETADRSQYMGRLKVWIPEFGGSGRESDSKFWYTVSYASPFAGTTPVEDNESDINGKTQQSYGMWMTPPDIGNQVLVCFVNGDTARGYWFACLYPQNMNQMVPAIGAPVRGGTSVEGNIEPVMEYNKKAVSKGDLENESTLKRKRFAPLSDGLTTQGLITDTRKGIATTSARRESPSRAFGFLTPRGNTIHIDDGELPDPTKPESDNNQPDNEFIRLRTRSGVGITIHETDGFVYIVSKNGKSFLSVSDDGVNLYSESAVSLRTTNDYNIQSSGDINIDAGGNLNIVATGHIAMGAGDQTYISAGSDLVMGSQGNSSINSGGNLLLTSAGVMGLGAGGNSIRQGAQIQDGIDPPEAPLPLAPERQPMPDGPGGTETGHSIGSAMPHHEPYSGSYSGGGGSGSGGGKGDDNYTPIKQSATAAARAREHSACIARGAAYIRAKHPDADFVTYEYLMATANYESIGFNANARSPTGATGLFQFTGGTWDQITKKMNNGQSLPRSQRTDPCVSSAAAAELAYENGIALRKRGIAPTPNNLYMVHNVGLAGATAVIRGNPSDLAGPRVNAVANGAASHNPAVYRNGSGGWKTNAQVQAYINARIEGTAPQWTAIRRG